MQTVDVQSVVYQNDSRDLLRAAEAVCNSARVARDAGVLGDWALRLGDGSPTPMLDTATVEQIRGLVERENGVFDYVVFGENLGSAAGHNRLAGLGEYEQLVILNPDALMDPFLLSVMLETTRTDVGFIEARQLPTEHPKEYDALSGETPWGSTACAMIPKNVFEELKGFDAETFFLYCDDVDFSWRVRLTGRKVLYQPAARLFHDKRLTPSADWPSSQAERYFSAEAALLLAYKYSRDDVLANCLRAFGASADGDLQKALRVFDERKAVGKLPERLDPDHRVATFVAGNYAIHRF